MKIDVGEVLQWSGAVAIIAGHSLNAIGPQTYPYNIIAFTVGTVAFLIWAIRTGNRPQLAVNLVAMAIGVLGLVSALG